MEVNVNVIVQKLLILIIVMSFGYIARKKNIFIHEHNKGFSLLIINITVPFLIVNSILGVQSDIPVGNIMTVMGIAFLIYFCLAFVGIFITKFFRTSELNEGVYKFLTVFNNNMFMALPLIQSALGDEAAFYCAIVNIPHSVLVFSLGIYYMSKHKSVGAFNLKRLLNPGLIASFICITLYLLNFRTYPKLLTDTFKMVGDVTIPLSMIVLGVSLADINMLEVFKDIKLYIFAVLKMLVYPVIIFTAISPFIADNIMLYVLLLNMAMPGPVLSVSMSTEYEADVSVASKYVFLSTLLSLICIPLLIMIVNNIH